MVFLDVSFEATIRAALVKSKAVDVADVAAVKHVIIVHTLFISQLGECVHDNTENDVQADDVDDDLESGIVHKLEQVLLSFVQILDGLSDVSQSTTISHTFVQSSDEALEHGEAVVLSDEIRVIPVDVIVLHSVLHVEERECGVNVNQNHHEHTSHTYLLQVHRDGFDDILEHR